MKKTLLLFIISFFILPLIAHEFWLQPEKFIYKRGDTINIRFWVGEDFDGSNWGGNRDKINSLQLYLGDITDDLSGQVSDEKGDSLQLAVFDEGTPMITFNSTNSFILLDAAKFNAYLKEDGLQNTIDYRMAHNETDSAGKEFYQRSVKTLVQVGDVKDNISRSTSLPLDIIPLTNPYRLKNNDTLIVRALFNKQIMANQLVNVWQRVEGKTNRQEYYTDQNGEVSFTVSGTGKWMVSTVKMIHLGNDPQAHWQSYWGSCTWGYE